MKSNDDKANDRFNEVIGRRSADGLTEIGAELNSAPIGQRCHHCDDTGWLWYICDPYRLYMRCQCRAGTVREAPKGAERRPIVELSGTPPKDSTE